MVSSWTLVEYRPGRYIKLSPTGAVLGKATDQEVQDWHAAHGQTLSPVESEPGRQPLTEAGALPTFPRIRGHQMPLVGIEATTPGHKDPAGEDTTGQLPADPGQRALALLREAQRLASAFSHTPAPPDAAGSGAEAAPEPKEQTIEPPVPAVAPAKDLPIGTRAAVPPEKAGPTSPGPGETVHEPDRAETGPTPDPQAESQIAESLAVLDALIDDLLATTLPGEPQAMVPDVRETTPEPEPITASPAQARRTAEPEIDDDVEIEEQPVETSAPAPRRKARHHKTKANPSPAPPADESAPEEAVSVDGSGRWLWVDPSRENGYNPSAFDLEAFFLRAIELFQSKAWSKGQKPRRLAVHPEAMGNGLESVAAALDLEVVSDPLVSPGTYRLALAEPRDRQQP